MTNHHKPSQTITNHHKPSQTITNHHKPSQTITNHHKPSQTITNHHKPSQTITNHHKPSQTITNHDKPSQTITNHHKPSQTMTNHHKTWQTITHHHKPWQTITNHDKPWQTMTNHDKPWQTITNHHKPWQTQVVIWSPSSVLSSWGQSALALAIVKGLGAAVIMVTGTLWPCGDRLRCEHVSTCWQFLRNARFNMKRICFVFVSWSCFGREGSVFLSCFVPENATHLDRRIKRDHEKLRPGYLYMPLCALLSALIFRRHYGWLEVRRSAIATIAMLGGFELVPFLSRVWTHVAMDQYLLIPFLGGWTSINPSYFDVNYRVPRFWPIPMCVWNVVWTSLTSKVATHVPNASRRCSRQKKNRSRRVRSTAWPSWRWASWSSWSWVPARAQIS